MDYDPLPEKRTGRASSTIPEPEDGKAPMPPPSPRFAAFRRPSPHRRLIAWLLVPVAVVLIGAGAGVAVAAFINMPEVDTLDDFVPRLITQLYDREEQAFKSYSRERRVLIETGDLPPLLQNAVVAVEDRNFFRHGGIDLKGVMRAVWTNLQAGDHVEGASTITMQLARELFLHRKKTWKRKIEEAFLAVELEKRFSKQQILTMYCNLVNEAHGNYGMEAAARSYFGKSVDDLTVPEAATLAGIPQRPTAYSVYRNPELVIERRNEVLGRMLEEGYITREEHAQALVTPLEVVPRRREQQLGPYFAEEVRRHLQTTYGTDALYDEGLRVYTTLDASAQRAAERALRDGLLRLDHARGWRGPLRRLEEGEDLESVILPSWRNLDVLSPDLWYEGLVVESDRGRARVRIASARFELGREGIAWTRKKQPSDLLSPGDVAWFRLEPQEDRSLRLMLEQEPEMEGTVLVIESATGAIRAMVGGWSFERNEFNRATQARRQVGSAFKPFVFGAALETGFTAADTLFDAPAVFRSAGADDYSPRNYYRRYYGIITLRYALERSVNVSAVKLFDLVGAAQVIDFAHRAGINTELRPFPSLSLGAIDLAPLELAAAYATLANQGIYVEPYTIERVLDHAGRSLYTHLSRARKATEPQIAYVLTRMLEGVVDRGTARAVANLEVAIAGKTGTTDDWTDAWFVGYTPRHTILTWVGYDKNRSLGRDQTGAEAALPIWRQVVEAGLEDGWTPRGARFKQPPGIVEVEIDRKTGLRAAPGAGTVITESFVEGTEPQEIYSSTWAQVMSLPWYLQEPFYLPKEGELMPSEIRDWTAVQRAWGREQARRASN